MTRTPRPGTPRNGSRRFLHALPRGVAGARCLRFASENASAGFGPQSQIAGGGRRATQGGRPCLLRRRPFGDQRQVDCGDGFASEGDARGPQTSRRRQDRKDAAVARLPASVGPGHLDKAGAQEARLSPGRANGRAWWPAKSEKRFSVFCGADGGQLWGRKSLILLAGPPLSAGNGL